MKPSCKLMMTLALLCAATWPAAAQTAGSARDDYPASALIEPCRTADNDSRQLGVVAQIECEQYLLGFVDALARVGMTGPGKSACPPMLNTGPEVRWAFMRWVYGDYTTRSRMAAADAVMQTLEESFPCKK